MINGLVQKPFLVAFSTGDEKNRKTYSTIENYLSVDVKGMSNDDKSKESRFEKVIWKHCSAHNVDYPASASCPQCDRARNK
jgi:hypothetical protein